ncbi:amino acid permease-domain-containing protein [Entophlyctis helioformis]|nr:amino acid permease-domain-containing protein [Entophlyctis helioformis]
MRKHSEAGLGVPSGSPSSDALSGPAPARNTASTIDRRAVRRSSGVPARPPPHAIAHRLSLDQQQQQQEQHLLPLLGFQQYQQQQLNATYNTLGRFNASRPSIRQAQPSVAPRPSITMTSAAAITNASQLPPAPLCGPTGGGGGGDNSTGGDGDGDGEGTDTGSGPDKSESCAPSKALLGRSLSESLQGPTAVGVLGRQSSRVLVVDRAFVDRRRLPHAYMDTFSVQVVGLWGIIVGVILVGVYAGFNKGIKYGFGSMLVAHGVTTVMVFCQSLALAEMATKFPFSSGCAAYTFAAFGGGAAAVIGYTYMFEFLMLTSQALLFLGTIMTELVSTPEWLEPLWWFVLLLFAYILSLWPREFVHTCVIMTVAAVVILVLELAIEVRHINYTRIFETQMPDGSISTNFLPFGLSGIIQAMPSTLYLYVGFEMLPVCAEETVHTSKAMPQGILQTVGTTAILATSTLAITFASSAFTSSNSESTFPHIDAVLHALDLKMPAPWIMHLLALTTLPAIIAATLSGSFALSRYIYALARGGYLPTSLALTSQTRRSPYIAQGVACLATLVFAIIVKFVDNDGSGELALLCTSIVCALIAYMFDMIVYIRLRQIFIGVESFVSPLGRWGAVFVIVTSLGTVAGLVVLDRIYLWAVTALIGFGVLMIPFYMGYIRRNLVASPEREFVRRALKQRRRDEESIDDADGLMETKSTLPPGHPMFAYRLSIARASIVGGSRNAPPPQAPSAGGFAPGRLATIRAGVEMDDEEQEEEEARPASFGSLRQWAAAMQPKAAKDAGGVCDGAAKTGIDPLSRQDTMVVSKAASDKGESEDVGGAGAGAEDGTGTGTEDGAEAPTQTEGSTAKQ